MFGRLLPTPAQSLLLRCLTGAPHAAGAAWAQWQERVADGAVLLRAGRCSVRGLNVALLEAMQANSLPVPAQTLSVLRLAALKEDLRSQAYRRVLADTLGAMARDGVPVITGKAAALAETVYPRAALRHGHDIDLLVPADLLQRAAAAARAAGFADAPAVRSVFDGGHRLVHTDGLPLVLHSEPLPHAAPRAVTDQWWQRAHTARIAGVDTRVAPAELALLQVCALAFLTPARTHLRWVTDCWYLLRAQPAMDWGRLIDDAHCAQLSRCLHVMLGYLADTLHAPVPGRVLSELEHAARSERLGQERALYALWSSTRRNLGALKWMLGGRRLHGDVLRWALLPSPSYLRAGYATAGGWRLPLAYLHRPLRFALERMRRRWRRSARSGRLPTVTSSG